MSAAHTPGPWAVTSKYGDIKDEVAASGRAVATVWTRRFATKVDDKRGTRSIIEPDAEGEANARLIAASPVLLNACRLAASLCRCRGSGVYVKDCTRCGDSTDDHACNDEERPCTSATCIAIRDAIAKAVQS